MVKSPEEYLSSLDFEAEDKDKEHLNAGERAFVEKYLGFDALDNLPQVDPEPVPLPALLPREEKPKPVILAEPQIVVVPDVPLEREREATEVVVATETEASVGEKAPPIALPQVIVAETPVAEEIAAATDVGEAVPQAVEALPEVELVEEIAVEAPAPEVLDETVAVVEQPVVATETVEAVEQPVTATEAVEDVEEAATPTVAAAEVAEQVVAAAEAAQEVASPAVAETAAETTEAVAAKEIVKTEPVVKPEVALKEKWRKAAEIQMVSFLVAGQIFLLPVEGIQEVVRHMELIKVPQAPEYIAGVINLRGMVMPIVHLSALLTNAAIKAYDESNFIIITGTDKLRLGLIIDKVSSMHMITQNKIIWNPESKLAEAAEFLNAIIDLDGHVCGMVAPENITRLILPELE